MLYGIRNIHFFMLAVLCLSFVIIKASESRVYYPVPKYHKNSGKGSTALSPLMFLGTLPGMISQIHFPSLGDINFSYAIEIIQGKKIMLGVATSIVFLTLLIKQLQRSQMGAWCNEKCAKISTSVDNYTNDCINNSPLPVQLVIIPIKALIQFLCDVIKNYVAMNNTAIFSAIAAPVTGRLLDCVCGCPIPLLSFTSIGWMTTGGILTKGFFDSHFETVNETLGQVDGKLNGIEIKIDENQLRIVEEIKDVKKEVGIVSGWLRVLEQKSDTVVGYVKDCGEKLSDIKVKIFNLEKFGQKNTQQLESVESQVLLLRQELGLMKQEAQKLVAENKVLQKNLNAMRTHSDKRFDSLEEKIENGFARVENKLDTGDFNFITMPQDELIAQQDNFSENFNKHRLRLMDNIS
jgi:hypothetical protein